MGHYYTPLRTAKIKNSIIITKCCEEKCSETGSHWWECQVIQSFFKNVWQFLIMISVILTVDPGKRNMLLPYNPAILLLGIYYPREIKTYVPTKACTWIFIAAVFYVNATSSLKPLFNPIEIFYIENLEPSLLPLWTEREKKNVKIKSSTWFETDAKPSRERGKLHTIYTV